MFAESEFSGARSHAHGGSENDHIKALRDMGIDIPEKENEFPAQLQYLYDIYKELRFSRIPNGLDENGNQIFSLMAGESLTNYDLAFYSQTSGLDFERWEIQAIMSLDKVFDRAIK